jgi:hypothetical protein
MSIAAALGVRAFHLTQGSAPNPGGFPATAIAASTQNSNPTQAWQNWRTLLDNLVSAQASPTAESAVDVPSLDDSPVAQIADRNATASPASGLPTPPPRNSRWMLTDPREQIVSISPEHSLQLSFGTSSLADGSSQKKAEPSLSSSFSRDSKLSKPSRNQHVLPEENSMPRNAQSSSAAATPINENVGGFEFAPQPGVVFPAVAAPSVSAPPPPAHNPQSHSESSRSRSEVLSPSHSQMPPMPSSVTPTSVRSESSGHALAREPQSDTVLPTMQADTPYSKADAHSAVPTNVSVLASSFPKKNNNESARVFPSQTALAQPSQESDAITSTVGIRKTSCSSHHVEEPETPHATSDSLAPRPVSTRSSNFSGINQDSRVNVHPGRTSSDTALHPLTVQQFSDAGGLTHPQSTGVSTAKTSANHPGISSEESFRALDSSSSHPPESWSTIGPHRAEAGFRDPSLGWITVRAQAEGGGIHATVVPSTSEASETLGSHLGALNAFMQTHSSQVDSVTLASPEHGTAQTMDFAGNAREGSQQQQQASQNTGADADIPGALRSIDQSKSQREPAFAPAIVTDRHVSVLVE